MMAERIAHLNCQTHENVDQRPSVFDVLAQETLMSGLKPAAKFALKIGAPYIKSKLDLLYEKLKDKQTRMLLFKGMRRKMVDTFVYVYPKLCAAFEFWTLLLQVGYLISKSNVHSPWLTLAGVRLVNLLPDEMSTLGLFPTNSSSPKTFLNTIGTFWNKFFGWICKMLGLGLYFVQFLDWMQSSGERDKMSFPQLPVPKAPHEFLSENSVVKMDPQMCPLCRTKRKNDTVLAISGYVFCYACIFNHIQRKKCCPVTKIPAGTEHLIRLYIQSTPLI